MNQRDIDKYHHTHPRYFATLVSITIIICAISLGFPVRSQSINCLNKKIGDADCIVDGTGRPITLVDFQIWRNEFFNNCSSIDLTKCGADEDHDGIAMDANFDYPGSSLSFTDTTVTIADFEIWRKGYFSGQNITTTPASTPTSTATCAWSSTADITTRH